MLLKQALLEILIKLADEFDRRDLEDAAQVTDTAIQQLQGGDENAVPIVEIEVDEDERAEIESILEQALQSLREP